MSPSRSLAPRDAFGFPGFATAAASSSPREGPDVSEFSPHTPKRAVRAEHVVETKKLGRSTDALAHGKAPGALVRIPEGFTISGTHRVSYNFEPQIKNVGRTVALVGSGGFDADAPR
jgi:hypothetical protein